MKREFVVRFALSAICLLAAGWALPVQAAPKVVEISLDGPIHEITAEYVLEGLIHAEEVGADAVLLKLATPGGFDLDMRAIVNKITSSKVPVIVYVAPSGSRAASAGFFILMAADLAVMAPGTTTGAASPVLGSGEDIPETMQKKVFADSSAYLRSYTTKRGRNPEVAELAVTEAKAFTDGEAIEEGLIDAVLASREDIFRHFHGVKVKRFDDSEQVLDLNSPEVVRWQMTGRQRVLSELANPNIAYLLLMIGMLGLYTEFNNPGLIFPGVAGGIALVMALFATRVLPVNVAGVALIVLALGFFVAEAFTPTYGILTAGGVVAMVMGALMLVESPPIPELRVRLDVAIGVAIPFAVVAVLMLRSFIKSRSWRVATGSEDMIGARGEVRQELPAGKKGMVLVAGELWRATADRTLAAGTAIRVIGMDGLLLKVEPDPPQEVVSAASEDKGAKE